MAQTMRMAWNAKRHWAAAGFLASTSLFLLFVLVSWHNERRGIASQRATGLSSTALEAHIDVARARHPAIVPCQTAGASRG